MNNLPFHHACSLFPAMSSEELERLAEDIRQYGLLQPIVLHEGAVLDGRNRLAACQLAGVEPVFVDWGAQGSPVEWVVSQNVFRRHLNSSQKAALALELLPMLEKESKRRMSDPSCGDVVNKFATPSDRGKASEVGAKLLGTNRQYIACAKKIQQQCPTLLPLISAGKLGIQQAHRICRMPEEERGRVVERVTEEGFDYDELPKLLRRPKRVKESAEAVEPDEEEDGGRVGPIPQVEWSEMARLPDLVGPESVDLMIFETPLKDDQTLAQLAEFAKSRLNKEGLALATTTPHRLLETCAAMRPFLKPWWVFATSPCLSQIGAREKGIRGRWRAVVAMTRDRRKPLKATVDDWLIEEECRPWSRHLSPGAASLAALAEKLSRPGQTIVHIHARRESTPWRVFPSQRKGLSVGLLSKEIERIDVGHGSEC